MLGLLLWGACKPPPEGPPKGVETVQPAPLPTWPEVPSTVFSSDQRPELFLAADGTVLFWVEAQNGAEGPLSRLDLFTGETSLVTDRALGDDLFISDDGSTVAFIRLTDDPSVETLHLFSDGQILDLGRTFSFSLVSIDRAGSQFLFHDDTGTYHRWTRDQGDVADPNIDAIVATENGAVAWCDHDATLHVADASIHLLYEGVVCNGGVRVGASYAVAWSTGDAVWAAWPEAPTPIQVPLPDPLDGYAELWWSEDEQHLAIRGESPEGTTVLWTWTRGDPMAVRAAVTSSYGAVVSTGDSWLFTVGDTELRRATASGSELLHPEVCAWSYGHGRVGFSAGDCEGRVEVRVLDLSESEPGPPFAVRNGVSAGPDGVLVVDEAGTAWSLDGRSDPVQITTGLDAIGATDWGWIGFLDGYPIHTLVGADWQLASGDLWWLDVGAWHVIQMTEREGRYEIDVVLLAR